MLLPTSPEFISLCRSQLGLLTQTLGADLGILYLTEEIGSTGGTRLIPIVSIPENIAGSIAASVVSPAVNSSVVNSIVANPPIDSLLVPPLALPSRDVEMAGSYSSVSQTIAEQATVEQQPIGSIGPSIPTSPSTSNSSYTPIRTNMRQSDRLLERVSDRLVLPLIHEEMVLGLLVTERMEQQWSTIERQQIEQVAKTLALSCVLDQRSQWLTQRQKSQAQLQAQQHDLMDNLIHQFRNPLTALRTFGKLLMRRLPETDTNREVAVSIVRESDRLQELLLQIDRAIDLNEPFLEAGQLKTNQLEASPSENSQLEETNNQKSAALPMAGTLGETELVLEPCDVRSILQPLLVSAIAVAQEKDLALHTEFPEVLPLVRVSPSALREVLTNLVDNAVKYTPVNGEVHIRIEATRQELRLRVTDNGLGIPDEDLPRLFQRHFRGVQAETEIPGTGLGLSIARELMRQMQGDIQVFSPMQPEGWISENGQIPPQRGVTFLVTLPTV